MWGDRTRLRQVLLNLVNNAIKFTSHGEIRLTVQADHGQVIVSVEDTGLGIPLHEQSAIFDEFRQSERTTARGYGGLGLGLAICRKLVEMHGGEIGVSSSGLEGEGSKFYFSLPVIETQAEFLENSTPPSDAQRVLLLVKDASGGVLLQKDLVQRGYDVELLVIEQERDWLASLLRVVPDVVVLDLGLASERGWEILKILKENPATQDIPVLFYSLSSDTNHGSLLEIDYLTKPVGSTAMTEMLVSKGILGPVGEQAARKAVLIVDDEPDMLEFHARIVRTQLPDYHVILARDGQRGTANHSPGTTCADPARPDDACSGWFRGCGGNEENRLDAQCSHCRNHRPIPDRGRHGTSEFGRGQRAGERYVQCGGNPSTPGRCFGAQAQGRFRIPTYRAEGHGLYPLILCGTHLAQRCRRACWVERASPDALFSSGSGADPDYLPQSLPGQASQAPAGCRSKGHYRDCRGGGVFKQQLFHSCVSG